MFTMSLKTPEPTKLEKEIDRLLERMETLSPENEEYATITDQLVKLYKLQEVDSKKRVSADTLAGIAANMLAILVIVNHEHAHVITSKAFGLVGKALK